jgi:hypothetical protein
MRARDGTHIILGPAALLARLLAVSRRALLAADAKGFGAGFISQVGLDPGILAPGQGVAAELLLSWLLAAGLHVGVATGAEASAIGNGRLFA